MVGACRVDVLGGRFEYGGCCVRLSLCSCVVRSLKRALMILPNAIEPGKQLRLSEAWVDRICSLVIVLFVRDSKFRR